MCKAMVNGANKLNLKNCYCFVVGGIWGEEKGDDIKFRWKSYYKKKELKSEVVSVNQQWMKQKH
jgi:hypothetical protein